MFDAFSWRDELLYVEIQKKNIILEHFSTFFFNSVILLRKNDSMFMCVSENREQESCQ